MTPRYDHVDVGAPRDDGDVAAIIPWRSVNARRLARHGLTRPLGSLTEAAAAMCGVHAQIMSAAEISLGTRVNGVTRADVGTALWRDRTLVKTFGPRGTVHLLPAADLPMWTAALAAVPRPNGMPPAVRLDERELDAVVAAVADALTDAELTTDELDAAVQRACGAWAAEPVMPAFGGYWPRWRQAIGTAATRGALCFGPNRGRRVTYTSPRRWLPDLVAGPDDGAPAKMLTAYLHAYGPAAPAHFAQWAAAPTSWARALFERCDLEAVELEGAPAWVNAGDTAFDDDAAAGVRLLPYFDAFAVGSHPRTRLFPGPAAERALAGSQAGNYPVLVVDGEVAGVWHQQRSGRRIGITVEPLRRLSATQRRALDDEIGRLGTIVQGRAELTIGTVTVGPHA
jgi:hypothetical protein